MIASSVLASLRVVQGVVRISAATVLDAARHQVTREKSDRRLSWWGQDVVSAARMRLFIEGREHLGEPARPGTERFVVMSNHQSHLDIPVLFHAVSPSLRMVTKTELFRFPLWGAAMRDAGFIEIDRGNRERAIESLRAARETLKRGVHVWIAPEGTRSRSGELLPFKKGGFMLALEAGARILPVGLWGTRDALPPDTSLARLGARVAVVIGAPIEVEGKDRDALMHETRERIAALRDRARALCAS